LPEGVTGFSTREVSEALGLPVSTILSWTRAGLLSPHRGPRRGFVFSVQDIALLRAARDLLDAELPSRRVREALHHLREQLPVGRPLSAVHMSRVGGGILVRDGDSLWEPVTGQVQLDLQPPGAPRALDAAFLRGAAPARPEGPTAEDWYEIGVEVEATSTGDAQRAYREALALEPRHGDAHLNLGRILHEEGALADAEGHYRAALDADPSSARAHYNLGVVLEDRGRPTPALEAYQTAVDLDPLLAAAHFNLSRLHEAAGRQPEALRHLAAYKRILDRKA
jgi:tetratricopeptide (TPR) repeat protein